MPSTTTTPCSRPCSTAGSNQVAPSRPSWPTRAPTHRWPSLSVDAAYRVIGREFTLGFPETFVGRLVSAALPFMSPASFLDRLATSFRMGREDFGLLFDVVESSEGSARAVVHNPAAVPGAFVAGLIEIALERLGRRGRVEVHQTSATDYQLLVRWDVTSPR
jgi:uncharacterized protein (TIGR02265 family)